MKAEDTERFSESESRVRRTLQALERPRADTAFRERLREAFVSGTIAERSPVEHVGAGVSHAERAGAGPRGERAGARRLRGKALARWPRPIARPYLRWGVTLAVAATIAIVVGALNEPARWTAMPSGGTGHLVVDGVAVPVSQTAEITRRVRPGSRIRLECVRDLDIVSGGALAMQLTPGTEVVVPNAPGRWFGRSSRGSLESGDFRITTGERFHGAELAISTPHAAVQVTGTTLAIIAEPSGTCVCVLEGTAKVGPRGGAMMPVPASSRCEIQSDGHMVMGEMRDAERPKLADLRDRMASVLR